MICIVKFSRGGVAGVGWSGSASNESKIDAGVESGLVVAHDKTVSAKIVCSTVGGEDEPALG